MALQEIFYEHVINLILGDLVSAWDPMKVEIEGGFHVRGSLIRAFVANFLTFAVVEMYVTGH
ncbi:MAG: hypothetical protein AB7F88_18125 [Pyrinomonadaceae bacterium]